jgi:hypothetical protein
MLRKSAPVLVLVAVLTACGLGSDGNGGGGDDVDRDVANAALEKQRDDVRGAARDLLVAAEQALPGTTSTSSGGWRGCESTFVDEFKNYRYLAQARVDVGTTSTAREPYLEELRPALEQAGFAVGEVEEETNGFLSLRGTKGDVSAVFVHTGAGPFVGLNVAGPCVDVAEEDRDYWLRRAEPTPELR